MLNRLKEQIKESPNSSGVYIFKNKAGTIIYIGRAINLKKRLANYIAPVDPKTRQMVDDATSLSWQKTKSLLSAIILEANLIKKFQPKYNIREKDNRSFVYFIIPKINWPYPLIVRARELYKYQPSNAYIFGPIKSLRLAKNILVILRKIFPYSTCKLNNGKPCFHYQVGLCPGKCIGAISQKDYQRNINQLIEYLKGKKEIKNLGTLDETILLTRDEDLPKFLVAKKIEAYDISHFAGKETVGAMIVFQNNDFDKTGYRLFKIKTAKANDDLSAMKEMIERRLRHSDWKYPNLILVDGGKTQLHVFQTAMEQAHLHIPIIGIAKFGGDKIVFGKTKKSLKELISLSFEQLRKIRDEAHRFANSYRNKLMNKKIIK
jgi:excinuclease ABC subunit C